MPFAFVASSSFNFDIYCTKVDLLHEEKKIWERVSCRQFCKSFKYGLGILQF